MKIRSRGIKGFEPPRADYHGDDEDLKTYITQNYPNFAIAQDPDEPEGEGAWGVEMPDQAPGRESEPSPQTMAVKVFESWGQERSSIEKLSIFCEGQSKAQFAREFAGEGANESSTSEIF